METDTHNANFSEPHNGFVASIAPPSVTGTAANDSATWRDAPHSDPAWQTAWRLQQKGVRLDQPWRAALPHLPVRITNVLKEAGYQTLLEVVLALQADAQELLGKSNFGRKSLDDLWQALEQLIATGGETQQDSLFADFNVPDNVTPQSLPEPLSAILLAKLEAAGISPDQPWQHELALLPVRVRKRLEETCQTLREVVVLLAECPHELLLAENLGKTSVQQLHEAFQVLIEQGPGAYHMQQHGLPSANVLLRRLEAAGIDIEQPWQQELAVVSVRLRSALSERFVSLREVVIAATDGVIEFRKTPNLGRKTLLELQESLNKLAQNGAGCLRYGVEAVPPASVDELIAQALAVLPGKEGRLLIRRCFDGLTLEELGQEYNVTRERIRQKVRQILTTLEQRFGPQAQKLLASLLAAVQEAGGLLHRDCALSLSGALDLPKTWLALLIAGKDDFRIWRGEFLTTLDSEEMAQRLRAIRQALWEQRKQDLYLPEACEIMAQASGFRLDETGAARLLITRFDCQMAEDGLLTLGGLRLPDHLAKILRTAGRPLHISEIADAFLASSAAAARQALAEVENEASDEEEAHGNEVSKRELAERSLSGALLRHEDIYQCGPKTFLHANILPVSLERLDEIVELCVSRIEGETSAVSADYLLRILATAGFAEAGLNKFLLKSALTRHPAIIGLKKFRVGHAASFQEHGLTLQDRIEAILRAAEQPLSSLEIIQQLPRRIEYFPGSIVMCLARQAAFAINLQGKYSHIENLGLSPAQRTLWLNAAMALLPDDGTPISCAMLLERLRSQGVELNVAHHLEAIDVLYGLLREQETLQCSPGYLVARRVEGKEQPLVKEVIFQIIREAVVASPRDIRRALSNTWGAIRFESNMNTMLNNALRDGSVKRLTPTLYYLAETEGEKLLQALTAHNYELREVLSDPELAVRSWDDLWLLARYCYRQNDFVQAQRLIEILQTKSDVAPEQRRSYLRLRAVIHSKL